MRSTKYKSTGFTLIELMIVIAIIGVLAAIAVPQYNDYIRKSQVTESVATLLELRTRMEQYYQDNRNYLCAGVPLGAANDGTGSVNGRSKFFTFSCSTPGGNQTYLLTATGRAGTQVSCYTYTVDQANTRAATLNGTAFTSWPSNGTSC